MPQEMSLEQLKSFLTKGTRTAVLATTHPDGRPHAGAVWYAVDGEDILSTLPKPP